VPKLLKRFQNKTQADYGDSAGIWGTAKWGRGDSGNGDREMGRGFGGTARNLGERPGGQHFPPERVGNPGFAPVPPPPLPHSPVPLSPVPPVPPVPFSSSLFVSVPPYLSSLTQAKCCTRSGENPRHLGQGVSGAFCTKLS